jgi:hypothetical protein
MHRGLHRPRANGPKRHVFAANVYSMTGDEPRGDPFLRFLDSAPLDDEPETDEERAAIAEVEADRTAGVPAIPFDEIKSKYSG